MTKIAIPLFRISIILFLFLIFRFSAAGAETFNGKWEQGVRFGPSFTTQDIADQTTGDLGPVLNYNISYGLSDRFLMGLNLEWEKHRIKDRPSGFYFGDESTLSIIPTIEYHIIGVSTQQLINYSPYILGGIGVNINSFSESDNLNTACAPIACKISPKNTLALKIGGGIDFFITSNLALNGEMDLKMNNGTADISGNYSGFTSTSSADNQMTVFSFLLGARYYY
ncbi:MAG: hypothetical protein ACYDBV_01740 [Nitrospiria bacterium]